MNSEAVSEIIAARLPSRYEPLLLTFYGDKVRESGNLIIFGDDYGTSLCLNADDECVYSVDPKSERPTRFVNSKVELFAKFLFTYRRYQNDITKADSEGEQLQAVRSLRAELVSLDLKAFNEAENWWAVILEQMEDGLL